MKLPHRRQFLHLAAGAAALPAVSRIARAQTYPARPVRIIVGFAAGGNVDLFARLIGQWLSERLRQPFIVENRPGAGTAIGTEAVVHAAPDGYTLLMASTAATVSPAFYEKLNFNFVRDITPVAAVVRTPFVMAVHPSVPAKTLPEFIAYAKTNSGKLSMASSGIGTTPHVAGELFKMMAGVTGACALSRSRPRAHRSHRRPSAYLLHRAAGGDRAHQGGQDTRTCGDDHGSLRGSA